MNKKKVAMLTWHYYANFGSALQAYALQSQLKALGYAPVLIDYRNRKYGTVSASRERLAYLLGKLFPARFAYPFIRFRKEKLTLSHLVQDESRLPSVVRSFDAVVCGSDQIWAPSVLNPVYLLEFVPDDIPKISYAASVGLDDIPDEQTELYRRALSRFAKVSVREKMGAALLERKCGITAQTVLDPTLLVDAAQWTALEAKRRNSEPYVFCYFLNKDHAYERAVRQYARACGLTIVGCSANPADASWMDMPSPKAGPCEFLSLIHHATCVFTDSYHGTIFSLLYHKPFVTFERFLPTDALCQNSRIIQLADAFGIGSRIVRVTEDTELVIADYDYEVFERTLEGLRKQSVDYLTEALECC